MKRSVLNRAVLALRTTTSPQTCHLFAGENGTRCALGVIAEEFGWVPRLHERGYTVNEDDGWQILDSLGLDASPIWWRNDRLHLTFAEIAEWMEANVEVTEEDEAPVTVPQAWLTEATVSA